MHIQTFLDETFGTVHFRCNPRARRLILRVKPDGAVQITVPSKRHIGDGWKLLADSREYVATKRQELTQNTSLYEPGALVGRTHQLVFQAQPSPDITTRVSEDKIVVKYPFHLSPTDTLVQRKLQQATKKALRRQAEAFLPPRVARLATEWSYTYKTVRIMSGYTRWGSCSQNGTISLNLTLMTLSDPLIDYVICHELCHTRQHNHSERFWTLVATHLPEWRELRKELKNIHPA